MVKQSITFSAMLQNYCKSGDKCLTAYNTTTKYAAKLRDKLYAKACKRSISTAYTVYELKQSMKALEF